MALNFDQLVGMPCVDAFGEGAQGNPMPSYLAQMQGAAFAVDGVYDAGWREIDPLPGSPVTSASPTLGVRLASFPAGIMPLQGDRVTLRGVDYLVREVRPDSHGWVRLTLNEAP